jgi:hypothetical protein
LNPVARLLCWNEASVMATWGENRVVRSPERGLVHPPGIELPLPEVVHGEGKLLRHAVVEAGDILDLIREISGDADLNVPARILLPFHW